MDILSKSYPTKSGVVTLNLPSYALSAIPAAARSLDLFVATNFDFFVNELMDEPQPLLNLVIAEAVRHRNTV
jgi:hypothetical protein